MNLMDLMLAILELTYAKVGVVSQALSMVYVSFETRKKTILEVSWVSVYSCMCKCVYPDLYIKNELSIDMYNACIVKRAVKYSEVKAKQSKPKTGLCAVPCFSSARCFST